MTERTRPAQGETRDITFQLHYEGGVRVEVEPLPARVRPGFATAIDVHVHGGGDGGRDVLCTATLRWPGGTHRWWFRGDVAAGAHVRVGTIQFEVPVDAAAGELVLAVVLDPGGATATATSSIVIA